METIVIITDKAVGIEQLISCIPEEFRVEKQSDFRFLIYSNSCHCWLENDDDIISLYDNEELAFLKRNILEPNFFVCEFSDIEFAKKVLLHLVKDNFIVDDDHGIFFAGYNFLKKIKMYPSWDWRF